MASTLTVVFGMNFTLIKQIRFLSVMSMLLVSFGSGQLYAFGGSAKLSDIEQLIVRSKCEDLLLGYGEALDESSVDKMVSLFAKKGVWGMEDKIQVEGEDALRKFWGELFSFQRPVSERHDISTVRISAASKDSASGTAHITLYELDLKNPENNTLLAPQFMVSLTMSCINTKQGWKFQDVNISPVAATTYRK